jgi:hypothetical protein
MRWSGAIWSVSVSEVSIGRAPTGSIQTPGGRCVRSGSPLRGKCIVGWWIREECTMRTSYRINRDMIIMII